MKTLPIIILGLLVISCASYGFTNPFADRPKSLKLESARNLAGYYAQPGTFELVSAEEGIVQQNPGVYINVRYDKQTGGSGNLDFNIVGGTMMLSLYSNETMIRMDDCLSFNKFNCSTSGRCKEYEDQKGTFFYPYFNSTGNYGNVTVFIDTNYWSLNNSLLFADDCEAYKHAEYGKGTDGIIGLGIGGNALTNFLTHQSYESIMGGSEEVETGKPALFSFYLNDDGKYGELIFQADFTRTKTNIPAVTLKADTNWHVSGVSGVQVGNETFPLASNLIFDINSEALGFPLDIYNQVIQAINGSAPGLVCPFDTNYRPKCKYAGKLDVLPTININVGDQVIGVLPSVYAEIIQILDLPSDSIILNLRGLSNDARNQSYVTPQYDNYVILDQRVMGYYYTVFDTARSSLSDPVTIKMYLANHGNSSKALVTILVCVVIGLIVGLSIYRYKKIAKARMAASSSPLLETSGRNYELNPLQQSRNY